MKRVPAWSMLAGALRSRTLSHAYLFVGPAGLGQKEVALNLLAAALCRSASDQNYFNSCGSCPSCEKVAAGNHPDIHWLEADGPSLKLSEIRTVLQEIWYRPLEGVRRCFVIADAGHLTIEAANRLLKILEEPPAYALFILMAATESELPATVVSRCYPVPFRQLSPSDLASQLQAEKQLDSPSALSLARLSGGNPGIADEWLDHALFPDLVDRLFLLLDNLADKGPMAALEGAEELAALDKEITATALDFLQYVLRDIWLFAFGMPARYAVFGDRSSALTRLAEKWGRFDYEGCVADIAMARSRLRSNVQGHNVLDALLLTLAKTAQQSG